MRMGAVQGAYWPNIFKTYIDILVIKLLLAVADAIRLVTKNILKLLKEVLKRLFV